MSLTLLYRSKKSRFIYRPTKRQVLTCLIAICGVFFISSRSTDLPNENLARLSLAQSGLHQQQQQLEQLKTNTEQRLATLLQMLAEAESRLVNVNALGARLVEQAQLNPEEFSFSSPAEVTQVTSQIPSELGQYNVVSRIEIMLDELEDKEKQLNALESILMSHHITEESALAGRPIEAGWLSSYYGIRTDPFTGKPAMHKGLDFAGAEGEPVIATGAGIVTWAASRYGYGELVEIDHGNGLVTRYGHNKSLNVKIGDVVTKGQTIALMGNTGRSTGAHVHYEVIRQGKPQDPLPFVYRD
jgi:murein DD-endopeptidase MepM/ murein hydrolase activator NlpD